MAKIKILLADDHAILRNGLSAIVAKEPDMQVVGEASTGREAVDLCAQLNPNVAVVDIGMPQLNGIDATIQIMKLGTQIQIVILSMHSDESYIVRALAAGAKGYILKDSAETDLLNAIRAVTIGKPYFSPKVTSTLLDDYVRHLRQSGLQDSYELLTDREREVLQLVAEGRSNKEAATAMNVSVTTVETHRTNLMHKLGLHSAAEIVLYAMRKKLIS